MTIQDALERGKSLQKRIRTGAVPSDARGFGRGSAKGEIQPNAPEFAELPLALLDPKTSAEHRVVTLLNQNRDNVNPADSHYRLLRSALLKDFSTNGWSTAAITSPTPGDGKTTTAVNLACCLARQHQAGVFLLDFDMRNPSVLKYLGISGSLVGLESYFLGQANPSDVLNRVGFADLVVAGSLRPVQAASELLSEVKIRKLLEYIRHLAPSGIVIVDLPPVCLTDEALLVAPHLDTIYLVVSEGHTKRAAVSSALRSLSGMNISGLILNNATCEMSAGYDRYY